MERLMNFLQREYSVKSLHGVMLYWLHNTGKRMNSEVRM